MEQDLQETDPLDRVPVKEQARDEAPPPGPAADEAEATDPGPDREEIAYVRNAAR